MTAARAASTVLPGLDSTSLICTSLPPTCASSSIWLITRMRALRVWEGLSKVKCSPSQRSTISYSSSTSLDLFKGTKQDKMGSEAGPDTKQMRNLSKFWGHTKARALASTYPAYWPMVSQISRAHSSWKSLSLAAMKRSAVCRAKGCSCTATPRCTKKHLFPSVMDLLWCSSRGMSSRKCANSVWKSCCSKWYLFPPIITSIWLIVGGLILKLGGCRGRGGQEQERRGRGVQGRIRRVGQEGRGREE
mmetsp:Transcript_11877/g.26395  ORF Transcript_11877/g.26395 Transcript_11877/m.26395 type:complete len:247 (+) Transcript_11877:349-1089(+)